MVKIVTIGVSPSEGCPIFSKKEFPLLHAFLKKQKLEIQNNYGSTDLFCAFRIVDKGFVWGEKQKKNSPLVRPKVYISFMYEAYKGSMFSWGLVDMPCMSEEVFIAQLKRLIANEVTGFDLLVEEDNKAKSLGCLPYAD
jgi:hypothetical protein